jgi:hypothetical protein
MTRRDHDYGTLRRRRGKRRGFAVSRPIGLLAFFVPLGVGSSWAHVDGGLGNRSDRLCVFHGLACFVPGTPFALVDASLTAGKRLRLFLPKTVDRFTQTFATIALATGMISVTAEGKRTDNLPQDCTLSTQKYPWEAERSGYGQPQELG